MSILKVDQIQDTAGKNSQNTGVFAGCWHSHRWYEHRIIYYVDAGLSATITTSSSSKVLVVVAADLATPHPAKTTTSEL